MASLGKRSRVDQDSLPVKRPRRQTRNFVVINDENQDPENATFEEALAAASSPKREAAATKAAKSPLKSTTATQSPLKSTQSPAGPPLTPSTPRFRHVGLGGTTPARAPVTPVTPRFRVMSAGKWSQRTPGTPRTPMTPRTPSSGSDSSNGGPSVYHQARQLFARSSETGTLVGRDDERERLSAFLQRCQPDKKAGQDASATNGGCLYVSGPPGTGKSAMVQEVTETVCSTLGRAAVRKAYVNCMSLRSSADLYMTLLRLLRDGDGGDEAVLVTTEAEAIDALQSMFVPKRKAQARAAQSPKYLVVLDEVDHVLTLDLESLYRVIGWSMLKTSRLVLVGIANALDLTDRLLPRLKSRNLQPELLPFLPYTAAQIKNIVTTRLHSLRGGGDEANATATNLPFFHPAAIELCSRKVASQTGDLRKAFEILRRALDLIEAETKERHQKEQRGGAAAKQPLGENTNLATLAVPTTTSWTTYLHSLTIETAPRVSIGHLNRVTAAAFGNGAQQRLRGLNLQQKAALCALVALEKWNRATAAAASGTAASAASPSKPGRPAKLMRTPRSSKTSAAPTIKALFDTYTRMCKQAAVLHPLSSSEFREVVGSLETLSLVTAVDGRTSSFAAMAQMTPGSGRRRRGGGGGVVGGGGGILVEAGSSGSAGDEKQVASCVSENELQQTLDGPGADILQSLLDGEVV